LAQDFGSSLFELLRCLLMLLILSVSMLYGKQVGLLNTQAAVDWAKANVAPRLSALVLMGCSAGSLGVQIWARTLLQSFSYDRAAVVADSFIGIMPPGAQQALLKTYHVCDNGLLNADNAHRCKASNLTIQHVFDTTIGEFPDVNFASINSKGDIEQIYYFNLVKKIFRPFSPDIDESMFFERANRELSIYNRHPNYVSFWVPGQLHMLTPNAYLYTANQLGTLGGNVPNSSGMGGIILADWLALLPLRSGSEIASQCAGQRLPQAKWPTTGTEYCDVAQAGKVSQAFIPPLSALATSTSTAFMVAVPAGSPSDSFTSLNRHDDIVLLVILLICLLSCCALGCCLCLMCGGHSFCKDSQDSEHDDEDYSDEDLLEASE